jgi:hypothetical protein
MTMQQFNEKAFCKLSAEDQELAIKMQEGKIRLLRMHILIREYEDLQKKLFAKENREEGEAREMQKPAIHNTETLKKIYVSAVPTTNINTTPRDIDPEPVRTEGESISESMTTTRTTTEPEPGELTKKEMTKRKRDESNERGGGGEPEENKRLRKSPDRQITYQRDRDIQITMSNSRHNGYRSDIYQPTHK